jgi:anti-sigma28 factor (negative regulator of flagellin synthesis)
MDVKDVTNAADRDAKSRVVKSPELSGEPKKAQGDRIKNTPKTKEKSQIATYVDLVNKMPDVREKEVARVKDKLAKGHYSSRDVSKKTAEKMLED